MKSETLVWVMDGVDYLETVTGREHRGTSHGLSITIGIDKPPSENQQHA